jgi:hypothetical protein
MTARDWLSGPIHQQAVAPVSNRNSGRYPTNYAPSCRNVSNRNFRARALDIAPTSPRTMRNLLAFEALGEVHGCGNTKIKKTNVPQMANSHTRDSANHSVSCRGSKRRTAQVERLSRSYLGVNDTAAGPTDSRGCDCVGGLHRPHHLHHYIVGASATYTVGLNPHRADRWRMVSLCHF